jgi:serine/threonine protein kinase/tetratricopeptide (TPR) repeat protein
MSCGIPFRQGDCRLLTAVCDLLIRERDMGAMDSGRWLRASGHLDRVLELPPEAREACVAALRQEDPESAADVAALLDEHRRLTAEGFLDSTPEIPREAPLAGVAFGAYTLVSRIGQGGMGTVWLALRSDGRYQGRVAVKLLNAALVGRGGEERFTREGTILARLTHPHIARLVDAGVSSTGQPYLVLEHIDGRHIDRFCDEEQLSVEARIRLFLDVLAAVAHAHANLIVHRDLKPSNVLVTAAGQVKLLDFSIAKLIADEAQPAVTMLTNEAGSAMTPKYAAPEQVAGGAITTATDVYALGVLLYELLTGHHPAGTAPKSSSEFVKAVTDTDPIRLSAAVHNAAAPEAAELASKRATTPERLRRVLRGDLETILGKALKKAPSERYPSVEAFADDLRRYIEHQPIGARPDTVRYRTAKFARRHWRSLTAAAAAVVVLVGVIGFYTVRLATERDRATIQAEKASRVSELLTRLLTGADPYRDPDAKEPTVQNLLDIGAGRIATELGDQPELQAEMLAIIGRTFERMNLHAKALPLLEQSLAIGRRALGPEHVRIAQSLNNLGVLQRELGNLAAAEPLIEESLAMRRRLLGSFDKDVAVTLVEHARVLKDRGRAAESEAPTREALAIRKKIFGDEHRETATSKSELALLLWERGNLAEAEPLFRESHETSTRLLGADHPNAITSKANLALVLRDRGEYTAAETLFREALDANRRTLGERSPEYAVTLNNLAITVELQGRLDEAQAMLDRAVPIIRAALTDEHPRVAVLMTNRARVQIARGHGAEAEPALRHVVTLRQRILPPGNWRIAESQSLLGASLLAQGRYAEAEPLMVAAAGGLEPLVGLQDRERSANRARLVTLYEQLGRRQQADTYR